MATVLNDIPLPLFKGSGFNYHAQSCFSTYIKRGKRMEAKKQRKDEAPCASASVVYHEEHSPEVKQQKLRAYNINHLVGVSKIVNPA